MAFQCKYCKEYINQYKKVKRDGKMMLALGTRMFSEMPICAFNKKGNFKKRNWSCGTMIKLRDMAAKRNCHHWNDDDESIDVIPTVDGKFIVLTYYKGRGKTGGALVVCDDEKPHKLTLQEAIEAIERSN